MFLQCLGKATLKPQNLFNSCSNQGLRLRIWAMRHASILRRAISSDSTSMSRVEALELLSKMLTFMKIWVAEHIYTQCSKFCQKMVMQDANDHNGMYERRWQMDANGTFTDSCWVWRMYIYPMFKSALKIWKREDTLNQSTLKIRTNAVDGWFVFMHIFGKHPTSHSYYSRHTSQLDSCTTQYDTPARGITCWLLPFCCYLPGIKHIGHPCGNWLNWRSCFCALVAIPNTIPPNQSTKVKRRGPGYDGHDVCNVPFDSQQSLRGSYWNPNHSIMLYEQVSKQFMRVMKFQPRFHETQPQEKSN